MASNTSRLNLLKKNPVTDGVDTFNIETMLNENWDKIDKGAALIDPATGKLLPGQENAVEVDVSGLATKQELQVVDGKVAAHLADLASQDVGKGAELVGLPDANNNFTSTTVGGAMQELFTNVSNGKTLIGGAITDVDENVVIPTEPTFQDLVDAIGGISTGKKWAAGSFAFSNQVVDTIVSGLGFRPTVVILKVLYQGNIYSLSRWGEVAQSAMPTTSGPSTLGSVQIESLNGDGFTVKSNQHVLRGLTGEYIAFE